uniref:EGF-like domain-containing protein n=1 Tax=Clastoptera arizonana TaxID=38151 RepID=A0A1B6DQA7_9HEMI
MRIEPLMLKTNVGREGVSVSVPKGKECRTDEECATIDFTACRVDKIDNKKRCLCFGNEPPINGECTNKRRELHSKCNSDNECIYGAECTVNSTVSNEKLCYCREGYVEENKTCNEGFMRNAAISLIALSTLVLFISSTN